MNIRKRTETVQIIQNINPKLIPNLEYLTSRQGSRQDVMRLFVHPLILTNTKTETVLQISPVHVTNSCECC